MVLLEVKNLTHCFPNGTKAIEGISLSINQGEFIVLAGANGSGKTVFIKHLNGLLQPTQGEVLIDGNPIIADLTEARKKVGLIFQDSHSQIVGQTVAEDVAFGPENLNLPRKVVEERVNNALAVVQLKDLAKHRPHTLSGGQKRRLAVAGVLAMKPKIVVFDEPFTGLDYPGIRQVLQQIISLHQDGHTIIVVTHELEKILAHATRLIIMEKGKIVRDGLPADLLDELEKFSIKRPFGVDRSIDSLTWLN